MRSNSKLRLLLSLSLFLTPIIGCGSGGGGSSNSSSGAANISVTASPKKIDIQDRTTVRIKLEEVNRNGIVVKVRYPSRLEYVAGTSFLKVDGDDRDITPDVSVQDGNKRYLVFFFPRSYFGDVPDSEDQDQTSTPGELRFELVGKDNLSDGTIEVDVDVDDPTIDNSVEFTLDNTAFQVESEASIEVIG